LSKWPIAEKRNETLEKEMEVARRLVQEAHAWRKEKGLRVKEPQKQISFSSSDEEYAQLEGNGAILEIILDEINAYSISVSGKLKEYVKKGTNLDEITPEFMQSQGKARDIVRKIQEERKKLGTTMDELVQVTLPEWPKDFEEDIKKKALIKILTKGDTLTVSRI
jgi:Cu/Ag efflux protein CusF